MTDEFSALLRSVGALEASVNHLHEDVMQIRSNVDALDGKVDELKEQANQWKGGLAVVLALGALLGWVAVWVGEHVLNAIRH